MIWFIINLNRKLIRLVVPVTIRNYAKDVLSFTIINSFLTTLLCIALWNNLVDFICRRIDSRDTRSSWTRIIPKITATISERTRSYNPLYRGKPTDSYDSIVELNIDHDDANNIEYDHTITRFETRPASNDDTTGLEDHISIIPNRTTRKRSKSHTGKECVEDPKVICDLGYYYRQYGINFEEFEIETDDGFIIDLWHLVPEDTSAKAAHPILLLHGLLQSSGSFASSGRNSLAYYLYKQGFDVWLGNNRCGFKPKWNMEKLEFDESKKWDWDMNDMVKYDVKAMVQNVLSRTGYEKLSLVGHSQGTTQGFMGLVNGEKIYGSRADDDKFRLIDKLENFVALAPAVYPGPLLDDKLFVKLLCTGIDKPLIFGQKSFIPIMMFVRDNFDQRIFTNLSYLMFNYLFDWSDTLWEASLRNRHFIFSPVHVSIKLIQWWLSPNPDKISFKQGSHIIFPDNKVWFPIENERPVSQPNADHLNDSRASAEDFPQILMFIPRQDRLVNGERLINHFINHEAHSTYKIWYIDEYSHMDVLWATDMIERVGKPLVEHLRLPKTEKIKTNPIPSLEIKVNELN